LDPIACDGHGVCAQLFPERISLDDWGYPIIDTEPIRGDLLEHARRAVAACPVLALKLERR
jgi:ferredoxin